MTRKDIYVFKAKFGVGNFEIEVYKLPVKKETAKAYFVDDHYTYRKKVLKEEIGITKELISEIMVVYLEENNFAKARSIFAAHNMERLEDTKKKIENFRKINAYLTDSDVSESKINELSAIEKDKIYRMVWAEHVTDDILSHAEDMGVEISKEDAEILAESYVCDGEYDKFPYGINSGHNIEFDYDEFSEMINFHTANLRPTKSLGVREPRVWLSETKRKTPECSGVSFFRAGNSNSLTNAFHICVYVHLCVVPRYIASQHPWKQSQSLLQNTKETTAGHFRRSVFLLSGRIPGVHELLWKAASLSCGRYR